MQLIKVRKRNYMNLIKQQHKRSCLPTCMSMLMGLNYSKCLKLINPKRDWNKEGIWSDEMFATFDRLGYKYEIKNITKLSQLKTNALLMVRSETIKNSMHAVVFDAETRKVLDPKKRKPIPA